MSELTWHGSAGADAVIYGAKSTEDRHDSIPEQLSDAREMCAERGWRVIGTYSDEGFSAYSGNRGQGLIDAETHATRAAAETGRVTMLVTQAHDRFARGAGDRPGAPDSLGEVWHRTRRKNVWLRSVEDDDELRDEASVAAVGRRAHIDSARKAKSVKKGHRRRKQRGLHKGARAKFGYRPALHPDGSPIPDQPMRPYPPEAVIYVEQMFKPALAGVAQRRIALALADAGIGTTQGGRWHQQTVRLLLADPYYAGKLRLDSGELIDGLHEALVDFAEWDQLQRVTRKGHSNRGGRPTSETALFTNGHLACGRCGGAMGYRYRRNRGGSVRETYVCVTREHDVRACQQAPVECRSLEEAALRALTTEATSAVALARRQAASYRSEVEMTETRLAESERLALRAAAAVERADAGWVAGRITDEDHARLAERARSEAAAAAAQAEQLGRHLAELGERADSVTAESAIMGAVDSLIAQLAAALDGSGDLDAGRGSLRAAFPRVTYREASERSWLDFGRPEERWVRARLDDELGGARTGEPVLGDGATTDYQFLKGWSVVAEVEPGA